MDALKGGAFFLHLHKKNGFHIVEVPPEGTTKRCAKCGVESDKLLWVREHSCLLCGYTPYRDYNFSIEVQRLGLEHLGVDFERDELFSIVPSRGQRSNIGLVLSVGDCISEGAHCRDELLSNSSIRLVKEAESERLEAPRLNIERSDSGVVHRAESFS